MALAQEIVEQVRTMRVRDVVRGVVRGYEEHDALTFAAAIAFQVLFAIIPLLLLGLGLLGGLGLDDQWSREWAPKVRDTMSPDVFRVVDDTVRRVLTEQRLFWTTLGAVIAIWKVSAAMRAIMDVFDRIYGCSRQRTFFERMRDSLVLGALVAVLLLAATGSIVLGDDLLRGAGVSNPLLLWLRWPLALALLFAVVALLVAYAPVDHQPLQWVTFGSVVVVLAWVGTSLLLGWYVTSVADYGSVFGALATIVVGLTYLYFASAAVLTGAELDAMVRRRAGAGRRARARRARRGRPRAG